jgi:hypothetical protein
MAPSRSEDDAYHELRRHLDTIQELDRKVESKWTKWKWAGALAMASAGHIPVMAILENGTMLIDYIQAGRAIERIFREYPQLKKEFDKDAALDAIESMKRQFIVVGKPNRMPELGKRRHVRIKQHGPLFNADDGDGYSYNDLKADECYRSFVKGTNRVCEASDGWVHFWYEPDPIMKKADREKEFAKKKKKKLSPLGRRPVENRNKVAAGPSGRTGVSGVEEILTEFHPKVKLWIRARISTTELSVAATGARVQVARLARDIPGDKRKKLRERLKKDARKVIKAAFPVHGFAQHIYDEFYRRTIDSLKLRADGRANHCDPVTPSPAVAASLVTAPLT